MKSKPAQPPPLRHFQVGGIYQILNEIVRMKDHDSSLRPRFEVIGYTEPPEDFHLIDWKLSGNTDRFHGHPLFLRGGDSHVSTWSGLGIIFKTPKAATMQKLVAERFALGFDALILKKDRRGAAIKKKIRSWHSTVAALFSSPASKDPKLQPTPEAKPTIVAIPAAVQTSAKTKSRQAKADLWENL